MPDRPAAVLGAYVRRPDARSDLLANRRPTAAFYGGQRPGDDLYTSSVVALRASTGQVVWHFQTTHHDVWDYDVAAQPTLATLRRDDREIPAVLIGTKMGFVFALERETGKPIFPIEERPVPMGDVPGEQLSPTQPIPLAPPPLVPQSLKPADAWGLVYLDRIVCRDRIAALRSEGLYTPPSLRGTLLFPLTGGGVNWGGGAFDPGRGLYIVNTSRIAHAVTLIPRADYAAAHAADPKVEIGRGLGTPYAARREVLLSPLGLPCNPPPWGTLAAVDMNARSARRAGSKIRTGHQPQDRQGDRRRPVDGDPAPRRRGDRISAPAASWCECGSARRALVPWRDHWPSSRAAFLRCSLITNHPNGRRVSVHWFAGVLQSLCSLS